MLMQKKAVSVKKREFLQTFHLDIIVPCYNVENSVRDCVDSLIKQKTEYNFRIILVDDGSKDKTAEIIDSYIDNPTIKIIHQQNKGHSGARNTALNMMNSRYVMFIDSDDKLCSEYAVQKLLDIAYQHNADIVEGGAVYLKNHKLKSKNEKNSGVLKISELRGMAWGKIIKSIYFESVEFPEKYWYEDSVMAQIIYPSVNPDKVFGIEEILYYYNINAGSISVRGKRNPKCVDSLWVTLQLFHDHKELGLKKDVSYYEYMLRMGILTYRRILFMPSYIKKSFFIVYSDFITKEFVNFHSEKYIELETAMKEKNYLLFKCLCFER